MRVLFWCDTIWPHIGGVEVLAHDYVQELAKRGHEFLIFTNRDGETLPEEDSIGDLRIYRFDFRKAITTNDPILTIRLRSQVARLKQVFKPDVIHVYHQGPSVFFHQLTQDLAPAPTVATAHMHFYRLEQESSLRRSFEDADWVTACSADVLNDTVRDIPSLAGRSSTILNGFKVPSFAPLPMPNNQRLLCIARLVIEKGFDVVLRALVILREKFPGIRLTIAGDGLYRNDLEQHAKELKVDDLVDFVGWVQPGDVSKLISEHDIVCMPSHREPFGLVALHAAHMERPIVAANTGGLPEIVIEGETGLLVDPLDTGANAEAIERLLDDPQLAARMGKAANAHVQKTFPWLPFVDEYESLYHRLAEGKVS